MKKLSILVAALLLVCNAFAQTWNCGRPASVGATPTNAVTATLTTDGTLTISGTGAMNDYDNTSCGTNCARTTAAWWDALITSVVIEQGVTSIGNNAFQGCIYLTSVSIPNSVISIGYNVFDRTTWYNNRADGLVYIGNWLYKYKGTMPASTTIDVQAGTLGIAGAAFSYCHGLTSISIPNSVISIGASAFQGCTGLTSISIPDGVTSIKEGTFYGCTGLTSISIPDGVTSINESTFSYCSGLTSISIPNSVISIDDIAFSYCSGLTAITVDDANTTYSSVDGVLFNKAQTTLIKYPAGKQAAAYTIPNSVTSIGERAFSGCIGLTSVTIPNSVTSIGYMAFSGCTGIKRFTIADGTTALPFGSLALYDVAPDTLYLGRTISGISSSNRFGTALKQVTIGNSVTSIPQSAFYNCTNLTSVSIPNSVTTINGSAFQGCTGIKKFTIADGTGTLSFLGLLHVAPDTLYLGRNLSGISINDHFGALLKQVTIGNSVTTIADYTFSGCAGIKKFTIVDGTNTLSFGAYSLHNVALDTLYLGRTTSSTIGENIFGTALKQVTIGNSVTRIPQYAFQSCTNLTSVTIPNSVTSIDDRAFYGCSGIKKFTIADGTSSLFFRSSSLYNVALDTLYLGRTISGGITNGNNFGAVLKQVTISNSVTSIPQYAFRNCTALTSVTIPNSVISIGAVAFSGCIGLTGTLTLPTGLTSIGGSAFSGCTGLTGTLTLPAGLTSIGNSAFNGCTGFTGTLTLPAGLTSIGNSAFNGCTGFSSIINLNPTPVSIGADVFSVNKNTCPLTVPIGSCNAYEQAPVWQEFLVVGCQNRVYFVNEGVKIDSADVSNGSTVAQHADPDARTGYIFDGWYNGASEYNFSTAVTTNLTLTAHWTAIINAATPAITTQPQGRTVNVGGSVTLLVTASRSDDGTLSFQWYSNTINNNTGGTAVGTDNSNYYYPSTTDVGTLYYYVVVTNTNNSVNGTTTATDTSSVAAVTVNALVNAATPTITTQPQGSTVDVGGSVLLSVTATVTDDGTLSYEWYRNTTNSNTGGTTEGYSSSYSAPTYTDGTFYYYVVVTNTNNGVNGVKRATETSSVVAVTVNAIVNAATPYIITHPQYNTVDVGSSVSLSVTADVTDDGTLSYEWYKNTAYSNTGGTLVGENSSSYSPSTTDVGTLYYYVVVTNTNNSVNGTQTATSTSWVASLTVNALVNAETPSIIFQPQDRTVDIGNWTYLSANANVSDGGTLSYQWYSNTTNSNTGGTEVGTDSYYYPSTTDVGTFYYYVVVTNTNNSVNGTKTATVTSDAATVTVVPLNSNANLSSLSVSGYTISPAFDANTTNYTLTVPNNEYNIDINAEPEYYYDGYQSYYGYRGVSGTGNKFLYVVGSNTFNIVVTAADSTTKTYTLVVTREGSSNANLSTLSVLEYTISPAFDANTTNYTVTVTNQTGIYINAESEDYNAQVSGTGWREDLNIGSNTLNIVVTAQNGTTKTYTLVVTREAGNANLRTLSVLGGGYYEYEYDISPAFDANTTNYTLTVPNNETYIRIGAEPEDYNYYTQVNGTGYKSLNVGSNTFDIVVTARDGTTKTYILVVTREVSSNNANLKTLSVLGYTISPAFDANTTAYTLTVPNNMSIIIISAVQADSKARSVMGTGVQSLSVGINTFRVVVIAEDNSTKKTYTIIVTRSAANNNGGNPDNPATAVETQDVAALQIYPNPTTNGELRIESGELNAVDKVEIYNVNGALVGAYRIRPDGEMRVSQEGVFNTPLQGNTISIAHLPAGIYLVKVGNKVAKVVKQ
ncbi:hypothetical protein AGMMS4956_19020 [Bacteroidia bacterium]|nr:hypothetical protein AGMMS4956_19020 [Bacteroidia bacterium]